MVDSRKSAQAKQQRRNRDGTYADEGKTSSMPTGDVLERFEQNQQSNTGGAPVETYETGVKRMQELDQKLSTSPTGSTRNVSSAPMMKAIAWNPACTSAVRSSRSCRNWIATGISHGATITWMATRMLGTTRSKCPNLPVKPPKMVMPKCISPIRNSPTRMTWIIPSASIWSPRVVTRSRLRKARTWLSKATPNLELTGNTYPQVWPTDADNNHRRAKLFYLGGSKGWRVTFSDGRGDVNNTVIDYKKSDMGSDYYDQTNTAREAFKTAFDWVDGGNKKKKH